MEGQMKLPSEGQEKIWDHFQNEGVDSFAQSRGRLEFLVSRLPSGSRVLNVGVGNGIFEVLSLKKGIDIWSLDPSERAIERLRKTLQVGEKAQVGYSQSMPFSDAQFDVVVMSEVLEHLDNTVLDTTLAEVCRVLQPGGLFLGTVPARENLAESHVICPQCGHQFHRWGHQRSFDIDQLTRTLQARFAVKQISEQFFIDWQSVGWWRRLQGIIKKILSWYGVGTYGICRNIFFMANKSP